MAVNETNKTDSDITINITNGDFGALKSITQQYNLKDETDVVTFAIGVLSQANGKPVSIEKEDGSVLRLTPSSRLKKQTQ